MSVVSYAEMQLTHNIIPLVRKIFPQLNIEATPEVQRGIIEGYKLSIVCQAPKGEYRKFYRLPCEEIEYLPLHYVENIIIENCVEVLKHRYK